MYQVKVPEFSLTALSKRLDRDRLGKCVTEMGFFYLTECGLSDEDHRPARDAAMEVFKYSTSEERQALMTTNKAIRRGYSELESESTAAVTNTGDYSDYSMCYSMGKSHNLFPSPSFEEVWTRYFTRLYDVTQETARAVVNSTGTYDGRDIDELLNCDPILRFRHFPEVPAHRVAEREALRMAPHYDLSIVTLIHQTPCANGFVSLQAEIAGKFVELPVVPDAMLVMCGAVATVVTQGAIRAPKHRVAAPPTCMRTGSGRTSSVFFLRPNPTFSFSVPKARQYGLDVSLSADNATFADWIGFNYVAMHTAT
jgi:isopenicillin N synthase-like dioxygenase